MEPEDRQNSGRGFEVFSQPNLEGQRQVHVTCNGTKGVFLVDDKQFLCQCSICTRREFRQGPQLFTPTEFERHSGMAASKKWKYSVRVDDPRYSSDGSVLTIGKWMKTFVVKDSPFPESSTVKHENSMRDTEVFRSAVSEARGQQKYFQGDRLGMGRNSEFLSFTVPEKALPTFANSKNGPSHCCDKKVSVTKDTGSDNTQENLSWSLYQRSSFTANFAQPLKPHTVKPGNPPEAFESGSAYSSGQHPSSENNTANNDSKGRESNDGPAGTGPAACPPEMSSGGERKAAASQQAPGKSPGREHRAGAPRRRPRKKDVGAGRSPVLGDEWPEEPEAPLEDEKHILSGGPIAGGANSIDGRRCSLELRRAADEQPDSGAPDRSRRARQPPQWLREDSPSRGAGAPEPRRKHEAAGAAGAHAGRQQSQEEDHRRPQLTHWTLSEDGGELAVTLSFGGALYCGQLVAVGQQQRRALPRQRMGPRVTPVGVASGNTGDSSEDASADAEHSACTGTKRGEGRRRKEHGQRPEDMARGPPKRQRTTRDEDGAGAESPANERGSPTLDRRSKAEHRFRRLAEQGPPPGALCSLCQLEEGEEDCFDTPEGGGVAPLSLGPLLLVRTSAITHAWAHAECARWCPEVSEGGGDRGGVPAALDGLPEAVQSARRVKCAECGQRGAAICCQARGCRRSFHLPCAHAAGCLLQGRHGSYCPDHAEARMPRPSTKKRVRVKHGAAGHQGAQATVSGVCGVEDVLPDTPGKDAKMAADVLGSLHMLIGNDFAAQADSSFQKDAHCKHAAPHARRRTAAPTNAPNAAAACHV